MQLARLLAEAIDRARDADRGEHLAVLAEPLVLSIRFGDWNGTRDPARAANWARYWRPEVQGYMHAYRAVTGVDLITGGSKRFLPPSVHLANRLQEPEVAAPNGRLR